MADQDGIFGQVDYTKCGDCGRPFTEEEMKGMKKQWDPTSIDLGIPFDCPHCEGHLVPLCGDCSAKKPKAAPIIETPQF